MGIVIGLTSALLAGSAAWASHSELWPNVDLAQARPSEQEQSFILVDCLASRGIDVPPGFIIFAEDTTDLNRNSRLLERLSDRGEALERELFGSGLDDSSCFVELGRELAELGVARVERRIETTPASDRTG